MTGDCVSPSYYDAFATGNYVRRVDVSDDPSLMCRYSFYCSFFHDGARRILPPNQADHHGGFFRTTGRSVNHRAGACTYRNTVCMRLFASYTQTTG